MHAAGRAGDGAHSPNRACARAPWRRVPRSVAHATSIEATVARALHAAPGGRVVVRAAAAMDAERAVGPAAAVLDASGVLAVDAPERVGSVAAPTVDLPGHVLLPPLVNAHAHLDLTSVGAIPFDGSFAAWAGRVRELRPATPEAVDASVAEGVRRSVAGGTGFVGDIAGRFGLDAVRALRRHGGAAGLGGVAYVEAFGIGRAAAAGREFVAALRDQAPLAEDGIALGVSPHAPYSCDDSVYDAAARLGIPASTHLAETIDELRFVRDGTGPFVDLLRAVGAWDDSLRGWGCGPVARLARALREGRFSMAHLNYLCDAEFAALRELCTGSGAAPGARAVPVYCPRASAFFGHPAAGHPPHGYREMLAAGIPVALGTDSAAVLGSAPTISVLDEMRLLRLRDRTDPRTLVAMATAHGAEALGIDPARVRLPVDGRVGARAVIAVDAGAAAGQSCDAAAVVAAALEAGGGCSWIGIRGAAVTGAG